MIGDKTFWPAFPDGSKSCARYLASLAFKSPRWYSVADKIYKKASRHDLIKHILVIVKYDKKENVGDI